MANFVSYGDNRFSLKHLFEMSAGVKLIIIILIDISDI